LQRLLDHDSGQVVFHIRRHAREIRAGIYFQYDRTRGRAKQVYSSVPEPDRIRGRQRQITFSSTQFRGRLRTTRGNVRSPFRAYRAAHRRGADDPRRHDNAQALAESLSTDRLNQYHPGPFFL
jgi:hypothetical protein